MGDEIESLFRWHQDLRSWLERMLFVIHPMLVTDLRVAYPEFSLVSSLRLFPLFNIRPTAEIDCLIRPYWLGEKDMALFSFFYSFLTRMTDSTMFHRYLRISQ